MFDLIVGGGLVVDGTGRPPERADVGVTDGRITAVADLTDAVAAATVDATGRHVVPGFVDAHSHGDAAVGDPAVQLATLRQGVTTLVVGQDGLSYAPATPAASAFVARYFSAINGVHPDLPVDAPVSVAELLDTWRGRSAVNTAYLVPHGTVRFSALGGADRPADADGLAAMRRAIERGLAEGAVGLSSGLEYLPGRYADVDELAELCRPVASAGLPYVTHMRGYGMSAPTGLAEALAISSASGAGLHVSHYHGPSDLLVSMMDDALAGGADVTFDSYPYLRGCTILAMAALPRWLDDTSLDRATEALRDAATRERVLQALDPGLFPRVTLAHVPSAEWSWAEGLSLPVAAERAGREPGPLLLDVLVATGLTASAVIGWPATTDDTSMRALLRHPAHVGGSDGIFVGGHPHPRAWGTFARYLGRHVRELGDWTWAEAVTHLAAHPARRFGLTDRGQIRPGFAADLAVIDPAVVKDEAWYENPRATAHGVDDVVVNGVPVLSHGQLTGRLAGTPLRPYPGR